MRIFILISFEMLIGCHEKVKLPNVIGIYKTHGFNVGSNIILAPNHKFRQENFHSDCFGSSSVTIILGSYSVQNNYVILNPTNYSEKYYDYVDGKEKLMLDTIFSISTLNNFSDSLAFLGWNKRLYLIATNDFQSKEYSMPPIISFFINNVNSGVLNDKFDSINFNRAYWNKVCSDCIETNLKNALPQKHKDFLLDTPLETQILGLEKRAGWHEEIATIKGGLKNGIRKGMIFHSQTLDCYRYLEVIEVYETYSKAFANGNCKPKKATLYTTQRDWN